MFNTNNTTKLAETFAKYVQHHDARAHALAQKSDITGLNDAEMEELINRMERLYHKFMEERRALLQRG